MPALFIAAERLGLATVRSGGPLPFGPGDELELAAALVGGSLLVRRRMASANA